MSQAIEYAFPPEFIGAAVELGAADGLYHSTTLELEQRGWSVLCIEANPEYAESLKKNRRLTISCACGARDGVTELPVYPRADGREPVASLRLTKRFRDRFCSDLPEEAPKKFAVSVRTLDWCLAHAGVEKLDLLSLDVDGSELDVLRGFDIERWKPKLAIIENPFEDEEIRGYFYDSGYSLLSRSHVDDFFLRAAR